MKKLGNVLLIIGLVIICCVTVYFFYNNQEIKTVKNDKDLLKIYENTEYEEASLLEQILLLPFSAMRSSPKYYYNDQWDEIEDGRVYESVDGEDVKTNTKGDSSTEPPKEYSKTNIQVEGVDEADVIKTDGDYIYSMSESKVLITNVEDPKNPKISATIEEGTSVPVDLILYKDKLVIISSKETSNSTGRYYYADNKNTLITIYDTSNKEKPKLVKSVELHEPYNTTRCIDGNLYVFSKGYLREKNEKIDRKYKVDSKTKELDFKNIKYLKDNKSNIQTLITEVDLNNVDKDVVLSSYLFDISNAYVSKNNIYLLDEKYDYDDEVKIRDLFTLKGVFGIFEDKEYDYDKTTQIYKFSIEKGNGVKYVKNTKVKGKTINQYSLDESDGNLRVALETEDGTQIVVLDKNLNKIGETDKVAEGENMYASRFMGDKAYLVTFKNTDPLFVIDLSDPKNPEVLGELKIPGYSTYLHPYDENHIIGIGMDTEEVVHRDYRGNVTGTWTEILGMKMALFDVSDVNNPEEIDSVKIGDSRTISAVLTNPKALLFSKEKNLLAIPVNNLSDDFSVKSSDDYDTSIENYKNYNRNYISEGYIVYDINKKGFKQKGVITHEKESSRYYYYDSSRLLRGLYIEDDLYTVSEDYIKVNKLEDLSELSSLKLKGEKESEKRANEERGE